MSSGFAGSNTKGMGGFDREVEARLAKLEGRTKKKLDIFTDEFSPPGVSEISPGQDVSKGKSYQQPHDDTIPEADPKFTQKGLAPAGDPAVQPEMDAMDQIQHEIQAKIKKPEDQFPGVKMKKKMSGSDNASIPFAATDPERIDGPQSFHDHMEKRMKRLAAMKSVEYKGFKIDIYKDPSLGFVACFGTTECQGSTEAEALSKAKKTIDDIIAQKR